MFLLIQHCVVRPPAHCDLLHIHFSFSWAKERFIFSELACCLNVSASTLSLARLQTTEKMLLASHFKTATWNNKKGEKLSFEPLLTPQIEDKHTYPVHARNDEHVQRRFQEELWKQTALKWRNSNLLFLSAHPLPAFQWEYFCPCRSNFRFIVIPVNPGCRLVRGKRWFVWWKRLKTNWCPWVSFSI